MGPINTPWPTGSGNLAWKCDLALRPGLPLGSGGTCLWQLPGVLSVHQCGAKNTGAGRSCHSNSSRGWAMAKDMSCEPHQPQEVQLGRPSPCRLRSPRGERRHPQLWSRASDTSVHNTLVSGGQASTWPHGRELTAPRLTRGLPPAPSPSDLHSPRLQESGRCCRSMMRGGGLQAVISWPEVYKDKTDYNM